MYRSILKPCSCSEGRCSAKRPSHPTTAESPFLSPSGSLIPAHPAGLSHFLSKDLSKDLCHPRDCISEAGLKLMLRTVDSGLIASRNSKGFLQNVCGGSQVSQIVTARMGDNSDPELWCDSV